MQTITITEALKWTDQAEVGQVIIFEESEGGSFAQVLALGATLEDAIANMETLEDWKNPTNRLIVA